MEIIFILYKPAVPRNVGSAARAIKTMGFSSLRLIDPCDHLSDEALMLAHGSQDILEKALCFSKFDDAVADIDFLVSTTAKNRTSKGEFYSLSELKEILYKKHSNLPKVGILFGTEESGLPNDIILKTDVASSIPLHIPYPSLNLSQAVMLYAYALSDLQISPAEMEDVSTESFSALKERIIQLLDEIGIHKEMPVYSRILERAALLGSTDINLLHSITSRIEGRLKK
jgi:tRNA/rRNA methyltransferase